MDDLMKVKVNEVLVKMVNFGPAIDEVWIRSKLRSKSSIRLELSTHLFCFWLLNLSYPPFPENYRITCPWKKKWLGFRCTLPETNIAPEKLPFHTFPKRKRSYSNHPFSGAISAMLVLGKVLFFCETRFVFQAVAAGMMLAASTSMLFEVTTSGQRWHKNHG